MIDRDVVIDSMCLYWLQDLDSRDCKDGSASGPAEENGGCLRLRMARVFDNAVAPHMKLKCDGRPQPKLVRDGIIQVHSFSFTESEKKRMALALKYGPASAAMKGDGSFFASPLPPKKNWLDWLLGRR